MLTVGTDTYISLADADAYWVSKNNSVWAAASNADKEKALIEATQYIDGAFTFIGVIDDVDQPLAWPRVATIPRGNFKGKDVDGIPKKLEQANAELALEALSQRLIEVKDRGGQVKREQVGDLEVEYMDFAPSGRTYEFVRLLLKDISEGSANQKRVIRA